jgi:hypothetical protein
LFDALISFSDLVQRVSFCNYLNFAAGGDLERFVETFTAILLAAENPDAAINEIAGRDRQRFVFDTHEHETAIRAQSSDAISHGIDRIAGAEDHIGAACCSKTLAITDNFIRTQFANYFIFICRARDGDRTEADSSVRGGRTFLRKIAIGGARTSATRRRASLAFINYSPP